MRLPTLYARAKTGAVQEWTIQIDGNEYRTFAGQSGGVITESKPQVCYGKNTGKKNETTGAEQALKEAKAKWQKKKDEGYHEDVNDIDKFVFFEPMLAYKFIKYKDKIQYPIGREDKLNGMRSCHFKHASFSRTGKEIHNIRHVRKENADLFKKFPDLFLDGELFNYRYRNLLNRIIQLVSVNILPEHITPELERESEEIVRLYVYDGYGFEIDGKEITKDTPFWQRKQALKKLLDGRKYTSVLDYKFVKNEEEVYAALKESAKNNWEGIILRIFDAPYESGRSKYLLKLKNFIDEEFEVVDIEEGTGNWAGCAKKIICKLKKPATNGETTFASNIRGTMAEMRDLLINKKKYIGKFATVEFQEYSEYGIPLIPYTGLPFRDYE